MDLVEDREPRDFLLGAVAWMLRLVGSARRRQPRELSRAWAEHGETDSYLTMPELRQLSADLLPGAKVRRHLFWRYSVVWRKS